MLKDLRVDFSPRRDVFTTLINGLDIHKFADGILQPHDRERIIESYDKGGFAALFYDETPIGFTVWSRYRNTAEIRFKWILPSYRGNHIGKQFGVMFNKGLLRKRIYLLVAQPATDYGYGMASSFEYKRLKETPYHYPRKFWYKFNKEGRKSLEGPTGKGYELLLWENEYAKDNGDSPMECYTMDEKMARTPILTITDPDAPFQIIKEGVVLTQNRAKYFFTEKELQDYGLLYISAPLSNFLKQHKLFCEL